jgi:hypothetical protein
MLKINYTYFFLIGSILLVYHKWIFSLEILTSGDWKYIFLETQIEFFNNSFQLWRSSSSMGDVVLDIGQTLTFFTYGVLSKFLGFDNAINERLLFFWPVAFVTPISIYILLRRLISHRVAVLIGTLIYTFNNYFLVIQTGHFTLMAAYAFAPLVLYIYMLYLEKNKLIIGVSTAMLYFILGSYEPRAAYIVFGILFLYFFYHLFIIKNQITKSNFLKSAFSGLIPFIIFGFLNIYWIFPLAKIGSITNNELFSRGLYGGELLNVLYSFTLSHPFWTGGALKIFTTQPIQFHFWLYPILAIFGLITNSKNKHILFFGLITLIGIFLSKQSDIPFIGIYQWLYDNFPGFNAYREASKFFFLTALGYSILIAALFDRLWERWKNKKWQIFAKYTLTFITIFAILWNTKPLITGDIGTLFIGRKIPQDFLIVKDFIVDQNEFFRTVWVPVDSRWSIYTAAHPVISLGNIVDGKWKGYAADESDDPRTDKILSIMHADKFEYLLDTSSVKYVIISIKTKENEEDWVGLTYKRDPYVDALNQISHLKKIDIGTKEIEIYENPNFKPHIYLTEEKESLGVYIPFKKVSYNPVTPTKYTINLDDIRATVFLNFAENYHPKWSLRIGEFNWFEVLSKSDYFLPDEYHTRSETGFNSFAIDPKEVCGKFDCKRNQDGSYDIKLTLFFKPQSYLYLGMIISGSTLAICLSYLLYYGIKKTKKRK